MVPFVTNSQFLVRYDWRWVAKNVLDGTAAAALADLQDPTTTAGGVLATLLSEASETVMAAVAVGARYQAADLYAYGGDLLARIVSDLCVGLVLKRRARAAADQEALSASYAEAVAYLEQLRNGDRIFWQVPAAPQAGLPEAAPVNPRPGIDPPLLSQLGGRYFGVPAARNGPGPNPFGAAN